MFAIETVTCVWKRPITTRRVQWESEQLRKHMTSTLARLAERQLEVTRLEKALSAALVRGDMDARAEFCVREAPLDAAPDDGRGEAGVTEAMNQEAEPPEQGDDRPVAPAKRDCGQAPVSVARPGAAFETVETAQAADDQNAMLASLFRFLEQDRKPRR